MSKGLGSRQRDILAQLQGRGWVTVKDLAGGNGRSASDRESTRRAVWKLEAAGLVETGWTRDPYGNHMLGARLK